MTSFLARSTATWSMMLTIVIVALQHIAQAAMCSLFSKILWVRSSVDVSLPKYCLSSDYFMGTAPL